MRRAAIKEPENETELKKLGNEYLESLPGCHVLKTDNMALRVGNGRKIKTRNPGMSDHHICKIGKFAAIEAKIPGKNLDPDQEKYKQSVLEADGIFILYHTIQELEDEMQANGLT